MPGTSTCLSIQIHICFLLLPPHIFSFNPDQEPSPGIMEDWRSSSPLDHVHIATGHPSSAATEGEVVKVEEGGHQGKVDLITCMPCISQGSGSTHLRSNECLMVFSPATAAASTMNPQERHVWETGGEEEGVMGMCQAAVLQKATPTGTTIESSDTSRPSSSCCFEGKLHFDEEEDMGGVALKALGSTQSCLPSTSSPCAQSISPDVQLRPGEDGQSTPPRADQSNLMVPNSTNVTEHHSKLPTPNKQLKKCSTFDKSVSHSAFITYSVLSKRNVWTTHLVVLV